MRESGTDGRGGTVPLDGRWCGCEGTSPGSVRGVSKDAYHDVTTAAGSRHAGDRGPGSKSRTRVITPFSQDGQVGSGESWAGAQICTGDFLFHNTRPKGRRSRPFTGEVQNLNSATACKPTRLRIAVLLPERKPPDTH